jgi:hypothetical protein
MEFSLNSKIIKQDTDAYDQGFRRKSKLLISQSTIVVRKATKKFENDVPPGFLGVH